MPPRLRIEGQKNGMLTFISFYGKDRFGHSLFLSKCDCGNEVICNGAAVRFGRISSCGCIRRKKASERVKYDLTGKIFGYLSVLREVGSTRRNEILWMCKCKCGKEKVINSSYLLSGHTKSCGCFRKENISGENNFNWKGGITSDIMKARSSIPYKEWRNLVFSRDSFTCKLCDDSKGHNLQAHHIERFCDYPELRYEISNGITLCRSCHAKISQKEYEYVDIFKTITGVQNNANL
jgi:hypothetical protein